MSHPAIPPCFTQAEKIGIFCICLAAIFALTGFIPAAILTLLIFLFLCFLAPFVPEWPFYLSLISRGRHGSQGVALTFDDGPFPFSTPQILELLARYDMKATFFVVGKRAAKHPELIEAILKQGHSIGNHSCVHDCLLMLRSSNTIKQDILTTQQILARSGVRPLVFRPPVGVTTPRLKPVLMELGLQTVTFSCRAYDGGNRNVRHLANRILSRLQPGDILLLHDNPPRKRDMRRYWHNELERLFEALQQKCEIVPLERLTGQPVMITQEPKPDSTQAVSAAYK